MLTFRALSKYGLVMPISGVPIVTLLPLTLILSSCHVYNIVVYIAIVL